MAFHLSVRLGAASGLIAVLLWLAFYGVAAAGLPGYDIRANQVSDLGDPTSPGAWAFNAGCILAGLMFVPFALSMTGALAGRVARAGSGLLAAALVFLILVGVFPERSPYNLHFLASSGFFILLLAGTVLLAYPLHESAAFGPLTGYLAAATAAASAATIVTLAQPLIEHLTVYIALLWTARTAGGMWGMAGTAGTALDRA